MAKQTVSVTDSWQLIGSGLLTIVISKIGSGAFLLNNTATDVNARIYSPADLPLNSVLSQIDTVPTYVRSNTPGQWEIETSEPGDGRFIAGTPLPLSGPVQTEQSAYAGRIQNDSFARLRTSQANTLFNAKMTYGIPEEYDQLAENGAAIVWDPDISGAVMSVAAQGSSRAVIQQAQYSLYNPGDGHDIRATYGLISLAGSCVFRAGYYDDGNGPFIQYNGDGTVQMGLRSSVTGSPVDTLIDQSAWNIDPLDGSGPSGITLDTNARQIFAPDLEWLSVGTVQAGFFIARQFVPVHSFDFANTDGAAYMTTADLPVRWELLGDGINTASVVAECCTVQSSGTGATPGKPFAVKSNYLTIGTTETLLLAIRPKTVFNGKNNHVEISVDEVSAVSGDEIVDINIIYNGTVTGGAWAAVDADSASESNVTASYTVGTGRLVESFSISASGRGGGSPGTAGKSFQGRLPFTLHLDGSVDVIAVTAVVVDGAGTTPVKVAARLIERQ